MKYHFRLGNKDADIVYWMSNLQHGTFSHFVEQILIAELKRQIAVVPVPKKQGFDYRHIDLSLYITNKQVIRVISDIPARRKSLYIKKVIRKHILENYSRVDDEEAIDSADENKSVNNVNFTESQNESPKPENSQEKEQVIETKEEKPISKYREKVLRMTGN